METIKTALHTIRDSFYNPAFYTAAKTMGKARPIKALSFIALLSALIIAIPAFVGLLALTSSKTIDKVVMQYPSDLTITIKDGVASTNVKEPYYVSSGATSMATTSAYAIIDTRPEMTVDELNAYKAPVILTQKKIYFNASNENRVIDLSEIKEYTLNREVIEHYAAVARPWLLAGAFILPILLLALLVGLSILMYMIMSIPGAWIVMLIAKVKGMSYAFGPAYTTALLAMIPTALIGAVLSLLGMSSALLSLLIFTVVVIINLRPEASASVSTTA